jgi:hypothetical protein
VSSEGHILQSVEVRPRLKDSSLVAWEAPWRESKTAEPSDNVLEIEYRQSTRLQQGRGHQDCLGEEDNTQLLKTLPLRERESLQTLGES